MCPDFSPLPDIRIVESPIFIFAPGNAIGIEGKGPVHTRSPRFPISGALRSSMTGHRVSQRRHRQLPSPDRVDRRTHQKGPQNFGSFASSVRQANRRSFLFATSCPAATTSPLTSPRSFGVRRASLCTIIRRSLQALSKSASPWPIIWHTDSYLLARSCNRSKPQPRLCMRTARMRIRRMFMPGRPKRRSVPGRKRVSSSETSTSCFSLSHQISCIPLRFAGIVVAAIRVEFDALDRKQTEILMEFKDVPHNGNPCEESAKSTCIGALSRNLHHIRRFFGSKKR